MNKAAMWLSCVVMLVAGTVWGIQRGAVPRVEPTFLDTGNASRGFAVIVGTTNAVLVYTPSTPLLGNYPTADRVFTLQNPQGFNLYCGTHPAVNFAGNPRWIVFSSGTFSTQTLVPTYCIFDVSGSTQRVYGKIDYDTAD
jgi:hypothetical protein